ncbi:four helix bundle protein [Pararhodonellum marinum]|uniref:four helix bundle protein n=1 Tax=Pararhodonellum marinum TaxID=2755358 RepID=UPI00188F8E78|nr:four helix bundle protein [Pararhodonellum marinum]
MKREFNLEDRLIDFAVDIIALVESLPNTKASNHLGGQLMRSGTSPALNYGEAQSSESRKDFIHKLRVILKELRESLTCIKIIMKSKIPYEMSKIEPLYKESNELISIFVKSIDTAQRNNLK